MGPRQAAPQGSCGATADGVSRPSTVVLVVSPATNADAVGAYSKRGPLFDGRGDGQVIVERSPTPFCRGARRLLDLGHDGNAVLVMEHAGSDAVALRAKLGAAAKLRVGDNRGAPEFRAWRQRPEGLEHRTPPSAQSERPAQRHVEDSNAPSEPHAAEGAP